MPQAVIDELRTAKAQQEQYKAMLGEEYRDYDLVIAQINGRPYEQRFFQVIVPTNSFLFLFIRSEYFAYKFSAFLG